MIKFLFDENKFIEIHSKLSKLLRCNGKIKVI